MDLRTDDGELLSATIYEPEGPARGATLIVPAMGVPQRFYAPFARWLAGVGQRVLTFDYRGMGASRRGPISKVDATILTWAERDVPAALDALAERSPGLPITYVGHSLGGQIVPFVPNRARIAKVVTVATGSGWWRQNAPPLRRRVWILWFGAVPLATPLFGYFPGRRLGMVGDLPRGVITQWRRWCLSPEYVVGVEPGARERFADVTTPIAAFSFTDDEMMSRENVDSLHGFYVRAPRTMRRFEPRELGVPRVGHFGFFRREMTGLWAQHVEPELAR